MTMKATCCCFLLFPSELETSWLILRPRREVYELTGEALHQLSSSELSVHT